MNEVFRFVSLRHAKPANPKRPKYYSETDFRKKMTKARSNEKAYEAMLELAKNYIFSESYILGESSLNTAIVKFYNVVILSTKKTYKSLIAEVNKVFGMNITKLVVSSNFNKDRVRLSDSFIAAQVSNDVRSEHREWLQWALLTVDMLLHIETKLTSTSSYSIRDHYSASLDLPVGIFPLPEQNVVTTANTYPDDLKEKIQVLEQRLKVLQIADTELNAISIEQLQAQYAKERQDEERFLKKNIELKALSQTTQQRKPIYTHPSKSRIPQYCRCQQVEYCRCNQPAVQCCCPCNCTHLKETPVADDQDSIYDSSPANLPSDFTNIYILSKVMLAKLSKSTNEILYEYSQNKPITLMEAIDHIEDETALTGNDLNTLLSRKTENITLRYGNMIIAVNTQRLNQ